MLTCHHFWILSRITCKHFICFAVLSPQLSYLWERCVSFSVWCFVSPLCPSWKECLHFIRLILDAHLYRSYCLPQGSHCLSSRRICILFVLFYLFETTSFPNLNSLKYFNNSQLSLLLIHKRSIETKQIFLMCSHSNVVGQVWHRHFSRTNPTAIFFYCLHF